MGQRLLPKLQRVQSSVRVSRYVHQDKVELQSQQMLWTQLCGQVYDMTAIVLLFFDQLILFSDFAYYVAPPLNLYDRANCKL